MVVNLRNYRFRGARAEGEGRTLGEAIGNLAEFWDSRPSLVVHSWGVLQLSITIGNTEAVFEIADPEVLDELEAGDTTGFVDWLAKEMGIPREDAEDILDRSNQVVAAVEKIRPPDETVSWSEEPGMAAGDVLPDAALSWVGEVEKEIDKEQLRARNQRRTPRARRLLVSVVESSMERGLTDRQIATNTGVPQSTVRDTRLRIERRSKPKHPAFQSRRSGQRLTEKQKAVVLETLEKVDGNAAEVGRRLGISPRTVRGLRNRVVESSSSRTATSRGAERTEHRSSSRHYTADDKQAIFDLVDQGMSATAAAREVGVNPRTGRRWVSKRDD
jgi:transposase